MCGPEERREGREQRKRSGGRHSAGALFLKTVMDMNANPHHLNILVKP